MLIFGIERPQDGIGRQGRQERGQGRLSSESLVGAKETSSVLGDGGDEGLELGEAVLLEARGSRMFRQ